jgi:hypothetical protein
MGTDGRALKDAVAIEDVRQTAVQMPALGRKLDRRTGLIADVMDDVEGLREPDEVAVVLKIARPAAAFAIVDVGRTTDGRKADRTAADGNAALRVAGRQGEGGRRLGHHLRNEAPVEPHDLGLEIHRGARPLQKLQRARAQEFNPELFQDLQRRVVNRLDLIGAEELERRVWIDHRPPGQLLKSCVFSSAVATALALTAHLDPVLWCGVARTRPAKRSNSAGSWHISRFRRCLRLDVSHRAMAAAAQ